MPRTFSKDIILTVPLYPWALELKGINNSNTYQVYWGTR